MPLDVKIVSAPPSLEISLTPEVFLRDLTSVVAPAKLTSNGKSVNLSVTTPTVATTTKTTPVVAQSTPAPTPHTAAHRVSSGK
jgi:hypothetical protein